MLPGRGPTRPRGRCQDKLTETEIRRRELERTIGELSERLRVSCRWKRCCGATPLCAAPAPAPARCAPLAGPPAPGHVAGAGRGVSVAAMCLAAAPPRAAEPRSFPLLPLATPRLLLSCALSNRGLLCASGPAQLDRAALASGA